MKHNFFAKWLVCFLVLAAAAYFFPHSLTVTRGLFSLAAAATALWLVNLAVRPILQLLALPITLLTFGLFSLVVNAGMVKLADFLIPSVRVNGFFASLLIALAISAANTLFAVNRKKS